MKSRKPRSEGQGSHLARKRSSPGKRTNENAETQRILASSEAAKSLLSSTKDFATGQRATLTSSNLDDHQLEHIHVDGVGHVSPTRSAGLGRSRSGASKWELERPLPVLRTSESPNEPSVPPLDSLGRVPNLDTGDDGPPSYMQMESGLEKSVDHHGSLDQIRSRMSISFPPSHQRDNTGTEGDADDERKIPQRFHSLRHKVGRVSCSLKKMYKQRGSRSTSAQIQVPVQQMDARRPHFSSYRPDAVATDIGQETYQYSALLSPPSPDREPPEPPPHHSHPRDLLKSAVTEQYLVEDLDGTSHGGSRVTSWTNSSGNNTNVLRSRPNGLCGTETPVSDNLDHMPKLRRPYSSTSGQTPHRSPPSRSSSSWKPSLECRRMYSALVRRIEETDESSDAARTQRQAEHENSTPDDEYNEALSVAKQLPTLSGRASKATIRMIPADTDEEPQQTTTLVTDCLHIPVVSGRQGAMSPSIYSFRPYCNDSRAQLSNLSLPGRVFSATGTAMVSESQPFARWSLEVSPKDHGRPNTSGDWRSWASKAVAGIESPTDLPKIVLSPTEQQRIDIRRPRSEVVDDLQPVGIGSRHSSGSGRDIFSNRHRLAQRITSRSSNEASPMNRFLRRASIERLASEGGGSSSLHVGQHTVPLSTQEETQGDEPLITAVGLQRQTESPKRSLRGDVATQDSFSADYDTTATAPASIDAETTKHPNGQQANLTKPSNEPKHPHTRTHSTLTLTRSQRRQRIMALQSPTTEHLLQNIRKGPYATVTSASSSRSLVTPPRCAAREQENVPPSGGQRMVDFFLRERRGDGDEWKGNARGGGSPGAFL